MTERRFTKKVYNDEQGVRRLGFYSSATPDKPLVTFDLNVLEDTKIELGEEEVAKMVAVVLNTILDGTLTAEELEYSVEDI